MTRLLLWVYFSALVRVAKVPKGTGRTVLGIGFYGAGLALMGSFTPDAGGLHRVALIAFPLASGLCWASLLRDWVKKP